MAKLKIMRTDGKGEDILKQYGDNILHVFLTAADNLKSATEHELGDLLISDKIENRFGLLVKEYIGGKIISEALRVSIIEFLTHIKYESHTQSYIMISKNEFNSTKEEVMFLCTLREFLSTLFSDMINDEEDKSLSVIITDYKK